MGKSLTNANQQQYRDEVGELIANYVVNVSDKLDARTERASKAVLIDSIAVAIAALRHPAAQNARKHAYRFPANSKGCVIWGTQKRALPELAALTNGVLLRCHDYNDFFVGRRNSGHSSDILSGALALTVGIAFAPLHDRQIGRHEMLAHRFRHGDLASSRDVAVLFNK